LRKKSSIIKILVMYFQSKPGAALGWIWVSIMPLIGSLVLVSRYFLVENFLLETLMDHFVLTLSLAILLGLALLPTTLTALGLGFFWAWVGFPDLLFGYLLANVLGFQLGKGLNSGFMEILFDQNPGLKKEIDSRINHPAGLIFFVRISPLIPFAISNFLFASLKIPLKTVLLFGVPGMLPRTFLAFATGMIANSFLGAKEALNQPLQWGALIFLLFLSTFGIYLNWKKAKA
jgi:uncharacterized membrane protein YdjX (TVP38/TMEM64 family)